MSPQLAEIVGGEIVARNVINAKVRRSTSGMTEQAAHSHNARSFSHLSSVFTAPSLQLNEYINAHGLKDPSNRQWALCDPTLKELTGLDRIKVFGAFPNLPHSSSCPPRRRLVAASLIRFV